MALECERQASSPKMTGRLPLTDVVSTLRVTGHLLLAAGNTGGFVVVDVTAPGNPVIVSRTRFSSFVTDLAVDGNLALLAEGDGGLVILDLTNPVSPANRQSYAVGKCSILLMSGQHVETAPSSVLIIVNRRTRGWSRWTNMGGTVSPVGPLLFLCSDLLVGVSRFDYSRPRNVIIKDALRGVSEDAFRR